MTIFDDMKEEELEEDKGQEEVLELGGENPLKEEEKIQEDDTGGD